jgi:hypothetical protein
MTVRELIQLASKLDPDAIVFLEKGGQMLGTVNSISAVGGDEEDEERADNGECPLADNWREFIGLDPGPAVAIGFDEV